MIIKESDTTLCQIKQFDKSDSTVLICHSHNHTQRVKDIKSGDGSWGFCGILEELSSCHNVTIQVTLFIFVTL